MLESRSPTSSSPLCGGWSRSSIDQITFIALGESENDPKTIAEAEAALRNLRRCLASRARSV